MQKLVFSLNLVLLLSLAFPEARAHDCGPDTVSLAIGQSKTWTIKNDEPQFVSTYTIKSLGDTNIVRISPVAPFSGNGDGVYTFTGKQAGSTTFKVEWKAKFMGTTVGRGNCEVTVTVTSKAQPDIDVRPTQVNFGKTRFGQSSKLTFRVFNRGKAPLNVSDISSDNADYFAGPTSFTVAPGDSELVEVVFDAVRVGFSSGKLTIVSNDPDEPEAQVSVSGDAGEPDIDVGPSPLPAPAAVVIGDSSRSNFRVTNAGGFNLLVTSIMSSNSAFSVSFQTPGRNFPLTLPPGPAPPDNFEDFNITFTPTRVGPDSAVITIVSDDPDEAEIVLQVKSTGLAKVPDINADSSDTFIGTIALGESSARTFVVANKGRAELKVQNITTDNTAFRVSPQTLTVAPGDSAGVIMVFAPNKVGRDSTIMTIVSNDPDEAEFLVKIFGSGGVPDIDADTSLVFTDTLVVGESDTMLLRVANEGNVTLEFSSVVSSNPEFGVTNRFPTEIRADGTEDAFLDLQVVFKPTGLGKRSGTLILVSNDPDEPEFMVKVSGNTHTPDIDAPTGITFPDTLLFPGQLTRKGLLTVSNLGTADLIINSIDSDGKAFVVVTPLPQTVKPGRQVGFEIGFTPTRAGQVEEELLIKSNDPDEQLVFVKITGFALAVPQVDFSRLSLDETVTVNSSKIVPIVIRNPGENVADLQWRADYREITEKDSSANHPDSLFLELWQPTAGTIAAGDSAVLTVQFNGLAIADTVYSAEIEIRTDIPGQDSLRTIPVTLTVQDSSLTSVESHEALPSEYSLGDNYPNPFNPTTTIVYQIPTGSSVKLVIYNMLGQRVRTLVEGTKQPGTYKVTWDGQDEFGSIVAGGLYLYRLSAGSITKVNKMILLK